MMKAAPIALAVGLFFVAGLAGSAYWRTVGISPSVPEKSAGLPPVLPDRSPETVAAQPATPPGHSYGASMTDPPAALAPQPESPRLASQSPAQQPATRRPPAQQAAAAAPVHDASGKTEDAVEQPANGPAAAPTAIPLPATKPALPQQQQRLATAKPQPARPHADGRVPGNANGPFQVQFGVFTSEENAKRLSQALSTPQVKIDVQRGQDRNGRALFYVRSPVFGEFARALAAAWDAQNVAQAQHFAEPVKYVILRGSASSAATAPSDIAISQ